MPCGCVLRGGHASSPGVIVPLTTRLVRLGPRAARALLPYAVAALPVGIVAHRAVTAVLNRAGHPAVPLDDAFIHFQFAKHLSQGRFFAYVADEGFTAGATSFLWPLVLAPFYALGLRDVAIIWPAWILGFAAHAALVVETYRLASGLTGKSVAYGAGAMAALFGAFAWFAASGMETMALAWLLARTARVASQWCETPRETRPRSMLIELILLAVLAPLVRPEGALASAMSAVALAGFANGDGSRKRRAFGLIPLCGPLITPLVHLVCNGSMSSNTTAVKWLPLNPYYQSLDVLWPAVWGNVGVFFNTLLHGEQWSAIFVPKGSYVFAIAGLACVPLAAWRARKPWRGGVGLGLGLSILVPCTYHTFLWNRLRYLWPFAPAWLVAMACAARMAGELAAMVRRPWGAVAPVLSGAVAGSFATHLS